jgi:hypothetical protein
MNKNVMDGVVICDNGVLHYGQTVNILEKKVITGAGMKCEVFNIRPHGSKKTFYVSTKFIQIRKDLYDYDTNPHILNEK